MSFQEVVEAIRCLATAQNKTAEDLLFKISHQTAEYPIWLLHIVNTPSQDSSQLTASILFKNYIFSRWLDYEEAPLPEECKTQIRHFLSEIIFQTDDHIRTILSEPLSYILFQEDFSNQNSPCYFFVALLREKLQNSTHAAVPIMNIITRRYRKEGRADDLWAEIQVICDNLADITRTLFLQANLVGSKPIIKLCNNLTYQELEDHFADHYDIFINKALELIYQSCEQAIPDLVSLLKLLIHHVLNYQEDINTKLPTLVEAVIRVAHMAKTWEESTKLQQLCLHFVRVSVPYWSQDLFNNVVSPVITEIVMPSLSVNEDDLITFEFSPNDYVELEAINSISDVSNTTIKGEAILFLNALVSKPQFSETVLNITTAQLGQLQSSGNFVVLVRLFTATSCIFNGPEKGRTLRSISDFCNTIIGICSKPPTSVEESFLISECLNFLTLYHPVIDQSIILQIISSFAANNTSPDTPLSLLAHFCSTLTKLFKTNFSDHEFEKQLVQYLYSVANMFPGLTRLSYYIELLTKLLPRVPAEISLSGDQSNIFIFHLLSTLFGELYNVRSLPTYNVALCRLISIVSILYYNNEQYSNQLKQQLLGPICTVISQILVKHEELTEIMPLALQLWALINTVHNSFINLAEGTTFNYLERETWEISGYVAGLCVLVQSVLITNKSLLDGMARNLLTCVRLGFIDRANAKYVTTLTLHIIKYMYNELDQPTIEKVIAMFNSKTCTAAMKSPSYVAVLLTMASYDEHNLLNRFFDDERLMRSLVKTVSSTSGFNRNCCAEGLASRIVTTHQSVYVDALASIATGLVSRVADSFGSDDEASSSYSSSSQVVPIITKYACDRNSPAANIQHKLRSDSYFAEIVGQNEQLREIFAWVFK